MVVPVPDQLEYISDANGVTKDFPYPKRFLQKDEIVVALRDADGIDTLQILGTHYTIAGSSWPTGGTVSFINAPQAPNKVVRYRMTEAKQTVGLANNQRNDAPSVELQLDRLTMALQDRGARGELTWLALIAETAARKLGDAALNTRVDNEAATRAAADNALNGRVDKEIIDRENGDKALASLIGQFGPIEVPMYDTRLAVTFAFIKPTINVIQTGGYSIPGDGGAALYKRASAEPSHAGKVQSEDGAWWELADNIIDPRQLGAKGDGIANDFIYVQAALRFAAVKSDAIFGVDSTVVVPVGREPSINLKWVGAAEGTVLRILPGENTVLRKCSVDGNGAAAMGIEDLGAFSVIEDCHIHHIHSEIGQARGIVGYNSKGGSVYNRNNIHDIFAPGDGQFGNTVGPSRAIAIFHPAGVQVGYTVSDNVIHDLDGEEADAIHVLFISGTSYLSSRKTVIRGNRIWNSKKRCIKVQAADTIIENNIVRLEGVEGISVAAIDVQQSDRCSVVNNDVVATGVGVWGITYVNSPTIVPEVVTSAGVIHGNRVLTSITDNNNAIYVRRNALCKVTDNCVINGRIYVETSSAPYVANNVGVSTVVSGQDGFINIRANSFNASVINNEVVSGSVYCCVRTDASKSMIRGNVNRAIATANSTCVYVATFNCVIMDNINYLLGSAVVRYQTGDATGQQLVVNNHQFTV